MDVGHLSLLRLMDEGRSSDVVPHLSAGHGEDEDEGQQAPGGLVVEELQVVSSEIEKSSHQAEEHEEGDRAGVVGGTEDADVDVGALSNPFGQGLGAKPDL